MRLVLIVMAAAALAAPCHASARDTEITYSEKALQPGPAQGQAGAEESEVQRSTRAVQVVDFRARGEKTKIEFRGTGAMASAKGKAEVEMKDGARRLKAEIDKMQRPQVFGPEFLTYVLWAIAPSGQAANLGEFRLNGGDDAKLELAVKLPEFGLVVTAEPYFAVTEPSDAIVLQGIPEQGVGSTQVTYQVLNHETYRASEIFAPTLRVVEDVPIEVYQGRNAVRIARKQGAIRFAEAELGQAEELVRQAQDMLQQGAKGAAAALSMEAVQAAERARQVALERAAQARREEQRRGEERRRQEQQEAERQRQEAERARLEEQQRLQKQLEEERQARERLKRELAEARKRDEQERQQQEQARQVEEKRQRRAALMRQLGAVLHTEESPRGLVVQLPGLAFPSGQYRLQPEAKIKLAQLAGILLGYPGLQLTIEGHTDNVGRPERNLALSRQRAEAVRDFLVEQGMTPGSLEAVGYGETRPIAANNTVQGRAQNRRVELIVSGDLIDLGAPEPPPVERRVVEN